MHILDDRFETLRGLPRFAKLAADDITVWTHHAPDPATLASRIAEAEAPGLFRARTAITRDLLERLPAPRLTSERSVCPHIDLPAFSDTGVLLCSTTHSDTPSYAPAEMTLALMLARYRPIPEQVASIRSGGWQAGVGRRAARHSSQRRTARACTCGLSRRRTQATRC